MAEILDGEYEERVDVDRLALHPRNQRRGNVGRVEQLIEDNGFHGVLLVQRSTGFVLAGNHTLQAAKAAGLRKLPVIWYDVDDDEALRILLGDNRGSDDAGYELDGLAALLSELEASDRGLAGTGWTSADLEGMLDKLGAEVAPAAATEADDVVPIDESLPQICKLGDVWLLGRHRLIVGDARDPNVIERALAGRLADMVWTDPPYGVDYLGDVADNPLLAERRKQRADGRRITGDEDQVDLGALLRAVLGNARTWCRPGGSFWVCGPVGPPTAHLFAEVLTELKVWRQSIVWVKDQFVIGRQDYHHRAEVLYEGDAPDAELGASRLDPDLLLAGWKPGAAHHRPGDRRQDTVWEIPRPRASKDHPTMKPVALIERALRNHTDPGEIVLDPFAGSGSTLIACHRSGRAACLVEIDARYADVICRRWEDHVGVSPRRDGADEPTSFRRSA